MIENDDTDSNLPASRGPYVPEPISDDGRFTIDPQSVGAAMGMMQDLGRLRQENASLHADYMTAMTSIAHLVIATGGRIEISDKQMAEEDLRGRTLVVEYNTEHACTVYTLGRVGETLGETTETERG